MRGEAPTLTWTTTRVSEGGKSQANATVLIAVPASCLNGSAGAVTESLGAVCARYRSQVSVYINCFSGGPEDESAVKDCVALRPCRRVATSRWPGMKGLFWKQALSAGAWREDFLWLMDADVDAATLRLDRALEAMRRAEVQSLEFRLLHA